MTILLHFSLSFLISRTKEESRGILYSLVVLLVSLVSPCFFFFPFSESCNNNDTSEAIVLTEEGFGKCTWLQLTYRWPGLWYRFWRLCSSLVCLRDGILPNVNHFLSTNCMLTFTRSILHVSFQFGLNSIDSTGSFTVDPTLDCQLNPGRSSDRYPPVRYKNVPYYQ